MAHPQDESGLSVPEEQWTALADYRGLRATGLSMADYRGLGATRLSMADYSGLGATGFTAQYRLGATATQTAVLDASHSRGMEAHDDSAPVRLPPIKVHVEGALPPWANKNSAHRSEPGSQSRVRSAEDAAWYL